MPKFDIAAALADGYSYSEIASYLSELHGFDLNAAKYDGIGDEEVAGFLSAREVRPPVESDYDFGAGVKQLGRLAYDFPTQVQGAAGALMYDPLEPEGTGARWMDVADKRNRERAAQLELEGTAEKKFLPGISVGNVQDASSSTGYSAVAMGPSIAGEIGATLAAKAPNPAVKLGGQALSYLGGAAGSAVSGYKMDEAMFTKQLLERANQQMLRTDGRPMTDEETRKYLDETSEIRSQHGLWEAGPEAVGNALEVIGLRKIFSGLAKGNLLGAVAGMVMNQATEQTTETITGMGQQPLEVAGGLRNEKPYEMGNPQDWGAAFKEQAPVTAVLGGVTGGAAGAAGKLYGMTRPPLQATPDPERQMPDFEAARQRVESLQVPTPIIPPLKPADFAGISAVPDALSAMRTQPTVTAKVDTATQQVENATTPKGYGNPLDTAGEIITAIRGADEAKLAELEKAIETPELDDFAAAIRGDIADRREELAKRPEILPADPLTELLSTISTADQPTLLQMADGLPGLVEGSPELAPYQRQLSEAISKRQRILWEESNVGRGKVSGNQGGVAAVQPEQPAGVRDTEPVSEDSGRLGDGEGGAGVEQASPLLTAARQHVAETGDMTMGGLMKALDVDIDTAEKLLEQVRATTPLPRNIGGTQVATKGADTGGFLNDQAIRKAGATSPATTAGDAQGFIADQGIREAAGAATAAPVADTEGFVRDQQLRRDAMGRGPKPTRAADEPARAFLARKREWEKGVSQTGGNETQAGLPRTDETQAGAQEPAAQPTSPTTNLSPNVANHEPEQQVSRDKSLDKQPTTNVVHEKPPVIGKPGDGAHVAEDGYIYRSVGLEEVDAINRDGAAHAPSKSKGGRKGVKHWALPNGKLFYRPDQQVIRVKRENFKTDGAISADVIEVWDSTTNTFYPISTKQTTGAKTNSKADLPGVGTETAPSSVEASNIKATAGGEDGETLRRGEEGTADYGTTTNGAGGQKNAARGGAAGPGRAADVDQPQKEQWEMTAAEWAEAHARDRQLEREAIAKVDRLTRQPSPKSVAANLRYLEKVSSAKKALREISERADKWGGEIVRKEVIRKAYESGAPVPPSILAEFPELSPQAAQPSASKATPEKPAGVATSGQRQEQDADAKPRKGADMADVPETDFGEKKGAKGKIKFTDKTDVESVEYKNSEYIKSTIGSNRAEAINFVERLTGKTIHDIGNTTEREAAELLTMVANRGIDSDAKHIVFGHGYGRGSSWSFMGGKGKVQDYVDANIPAGEKAWCVTCDDDNKRNFAGAEGRELISAAQPAQAEAASGERGEEDGYKPASELTREEYAEMLKKEKVGPKNKDVIRQSQDIAILRELFEDEIKEDSFARGIYRKIQDLQSGMLRNGMKVKVADEAAFNSVERGIKELFERAISEGKVVPEMILAENADLAPKEANKYEGFTFSKNDVSLEAATRAHQATSFSPDKRGQQEQEGYAGHMRNVLDSLLPLAKTAEQKAELREWFNDYYRPGYLKRLSAQLSAASRTMSAMITGPAKFPTSRNQKALDVESKRTSELVEWSKKSFAKMRAKLNGSEAISSTDVDAKAKLEKKLASLVESQEMMKAANKIIKDRNLDEQGKVDAIMAAGLSEKAARAVLTTPDFMGRIGFAPHSLQNNNAEIRRIKERIAELDNREQKAEETGGSIEEEFEGGRVELNYEDGYIRIFHDAKPDKETREKLKSNGFRWTPSETAWRRKLTLNGKYAAEQVTGVKFSEAEQADPTETATVEPEAETETATESPTRLHTVSGYPSDNATKKHMLEAIAEARKELPEPNPKDGFSNAERIDWPKPYTEKSHKIYRLAGNFKLVVDPTGYARLTEDMGSSGKDGGKIPDKVHGKPIGNLAEAKLWAEYYLLGKTDPSGPPHVFRGKDKEYEYTIPNSAYALDNFEKKVKGSSGVKFSERTGPTIESIKAKYAGRIDTIFVHERSDGDIHLASVIVGKGNRQQGIGSEFMADLVAYADANGKRIVLSPGQPDDRHGTTSRARLVRFYKRFGFIENKGRNKDYQISEGMYRVPAPKYSTALPPSARADIQGERPIKLSSGTIEALEQQGFKIDEKAWEDTDELAAAVNYAFEPIPWRLPNSLIGRDRKGRVEQAGTPRSDFELTERLAKIFNKRVIWTTFGEKETINGLVASTLPGRIFLNPLANNPSHVVFGHELSHWLELEHPAIYADLYEAVEPLIIYTEEYRNRFEHLRELSDYAVNTEIIGDLMGDAFADQKFWNLVAEQAGGKKFKGIVKKIIRWINSIVDRLAGLVGYNVHPLVKDLRKTKYALARAVARYGEASPKQARVAMGEGVRQSVRDLFKPVDTESAAFKRWFGDSKVVDADGKPLVVYHGTPMAGFDALDIDKAGTNIDSGYMGRGVYLTNSASAASYYANTGGMESPGVYPLYVSMNNPFKFGKKTQGIRGLVFRGEPLPGDLTESVIKRSGVVFDIEKAKDGFYFDNQDWFLEGDLSAALTEELKSRGFDGVISEDENGYKEIVAFRPNQIKSALSNTGDFSPSDPRIRYSKRFEADEADERNPPPLEGTTTEDPYEQATKIERNKYLALRRSTSATLKSIAGGVDKYLGAISTRLRNISPKLEHKIRQLDFNIGTNHTRDVRAVEPLLKLAKQKMSKMDFIIWDLARKNSDVKRIDELVKKYGIRKEYDAYRKVLDRVFKEAQEVGIELGWINEYAPRVIKDAQGFLNELGRGNDWPVLTQKLKEVARRMDITVADMTPEMKADIISNMLFSGYYGMGAPGSTKERSIAMIPPKLNQYYMDSDAALTQYLHSMRKHIEARRFFGKVPQKISEAKRNMHAAMKRLREEEAKEMPNQARIEMWRDSIAGYRGVLEKYKNQRDYTDNIAQYVIDLMESGELSPENENVLKDILNARFNEHGTRGVIQAYKNFSYLDTMGSPISAITQIGDLAWSIYANGWTRTLRGISKSALGKAKITKEDVGIERIAQEFADTDTLSKAVAKVFRWIGLEKMDTIGKESFLNGAFERFVAEAKKDPKGLERKLEQTFEEDAALVVDDLQNERITENVKLLVYSDLLNFQPAAMSEMPEQYLLAGNGRLFYMLKTYTLKQFDVFRREGYNAIRNGTKTEKIDAIRKVAYLAMLLVLANGAADELKDWLLGRKTDLSDRVTDNVLRLFGVSKYMTWKARTEGYGSAIVRQILPPFKFVDSLSKDILSAGDGKGLQTPQSVPVVGKLAYWHIGRGMDAHRDLWEIRFSKERRRLEEIKERVEENPDLASKYRQEMRRLKAFRRAQYRINQMKSASNKLRQTERRTGSDYSGRIDAVEQRRIAAIKRFLGAQQ